MTYLEDILLVSFVFLVQSYSLLELDPLASATAAIATSDTRPGDLLHPVHSPEAQWCCIIFE